MGRWNAAANEIFLQALEHDAPMRRRAYLDEACGADTELRAEVESLLAARAQVGDFLESPARGWRRPSTSPSPNSPARLIGRYKLLEQIGEGGFGVVYMAEQQEPVRRKVALKIIKLGHGHQAGHRPLRGRAAGAGDDGPPEHRQGPRRRGDRDRPALFRDGAGPRASRSPSTATRTS